MDRKKSLIIIGAGPAGMAAALSACREGADVLVLEHNAQAGRKLLLTGNGACNFTNTDVAPEHYHASDAGFVAEVLRQFSYADCIGWFREIGIEPEIRHYRFDESGYAYPKDGNARTLRDALLKACEAAGVRFQYETAGEKLRIEADPAGGFQIAGIDADTGGEIDGEPRPKAQRHADALILAAGSNAYPVTGSDSSLYPLLKQLDLGFTGFFPALCALYTKDARLASLKGRRVTADVRLLIDGVPVAESYGEVQFTEHTISGIPVMQVSGYASRALKQKSRIRLTVNDDTFEIYKTAGFDRAQCCAGGIDLACVDPSTMESKRAENVYICGELLDVDGECGGYNLHFAWASGVIAGRSAAGKEKS